MANPLVPVVLRLLSAAQTHQLRLLAELGVNRHIPQHTAGTLRRMGLIEWSGPSSSWDGMQAGGYMLTEAGRELVGTSGVTPTFNDQQEQPR
jgi:hypothetical protein